MGLLYNSGNPIFLYFCRLFLNPKNMENYDEYNAMQNAMQAKADKENEYDAMLEGYYENIETVQDKKVALMTSDNWENYNYLFELMINKQSLSLLIGIKEGLPYYKFELHEMPITVFITKEIRRQIYNYLKDGVIPDKMPNVSDVYSNMDETFILHHFKKDFENNVATYSETTKEYKAKYNHGIINYGVLPYSPDELKAKLNSL